MEEGKPNSSAIGSAMLRAAHLLWDNPPKIFEDTLAMRLSGCESDAALRAELDRIQSEIARSTGPDFAVTMLRSLTAMTVMRSRYVEDEVDQAVGRGVSQYVILGAGLDSFAYRRPDLAKVLRVFEVDHPTAQAWKRSRLRETGIELPLNLNLVPVDFEKDSLIDNLRANGYQTDAAGLFSWLGVTMYLTPDAVFSTLRTTATLAPGTEIIFQYTVPKELCDEESQRLLAVVMPVSTARGEPWQSSFVPATLSEQVSKLGFAEVSDLGPEEARARYFADRTDGLRPPTSEHYMRARVGPHSN
ncbi:MAG: class I SAM-dependent methyltransferase [Deltaproteobacteria bacterium]|nr:class I SAM-dependent methyltransferase [Deltaproteobacteria bacterium]